MTYFEIQTECPHCDLTIDLVCSVLSVNKGEAETESKKLAILHQIKKTNTSMKELIEYAKEQGITKKQLDSIIRLLKIEGEIVEIKKGEFIIL